MWSTVILKMVCSQGESLIHQFKQINSNQILLQNIHNDLDSFKHHNQHDTFLDTAELKQAEFHQLPCGIAQFSDVAIVSFYYSAKTQN